MENAKIGNFLKVKIGLLIFSIILHRPLGIVVL